MCRIDKKGNQKVASVKVVFEDDTVIIRRKGKDVNQYEVDGETYENFGYNVPPQVTEAIKIYPFVTNKESFNLNVAMQEERPFLIHESAPVRASVLDVLTGNSLLQKAISSFNKENVAKSKEITQLEQEISNDTHILEAMPDLEKAEKLLDDATSIQNRIDEDLDADLRWLVGTREDYTTYKGVVERIGELPDLSIIDKKIDKLTELDIALVSLKRLNKEYSTHSKKIIDLPDIDEITELIGKLEELQDQLEIIKEMGRSYDYNRVNHSSNNEIVEEAIQDLQKLYIANPTCPTCGKAWASK